MFTLNILMPFKTITIKQSVYRDLVNSKMPGESFSELFERVLGDKRPNLRDFYGAWKLKKGEEKQIEILLKKERALLDQSFEKRMRRKLYESPGQ